MNDVWMRSGQTEMLGKRCTNVADISPVSSEESTIFRADCHRNNCAPKCFFLKDTSLKKWQMYLDSIDLVSVNNDVLGLL